MLHPVSSRILHGENPLEIDPALDYAHAPDHSIPAWNETWFFSAWSPDTGVGVFIHVGVDPSDDELRYAQVIAYLPGGEIIADRTWDRPAIGNPFTVGAFTIETLEPLEHWRISFAGAGERTTSHESGLRPIGSGPVTPLTFTIDITAAGPIWDLFKASGIPSTEWAKLHHEQNCFTRGTLTAGPDTYQIDGVGFRDHSTGPRQFNRLGGDRFWGFVSPTTGRSCQGLMVWSRTGSLEIASASYHENGTLELINGPVTLTGIEDTFGNPTDLTLTLERPNGGTLTAHGTVEHKITISILDPDHNVNGAWLTDDPLILSESQVRFEWPDGDVLYGHLERVARLNDITHPDLTLAAANGARVSRSTSPVT